MLYEESMINICLFLKSKKKKKAKNPPKKHGFLF